LVLLFCVINQLSTAQTLLGVKAGTGFTKLKSDEFASKSGSGYYVGFSFNTLISEKIDFVNEFGLVHNNTFVESREFVDAFPNDKFSEDITEVNLKYTGLFVTYLANYYIKYPNVSVFAGPALAFYINTSGQDIPELTYLGKGSADTYTQGVQVDDLAQSLTYGDVALKSGLMLGTENLKVQIAYYLSFIPVKAESYQPNIEDYIAKRNTVELTLNYIFPNLRVR
jgi:hypothetical protein